MGPNNYLFSIPASLAHNFYHYFLLLKSVRGTSHDQKDQASHHKDNQEVIWDRFHGNWSFRGHTEIPLAKIVEYSTRKSILYGTIDVNGTLLVAQ